VTAILLLVITSNEERIPTLREWAIKPGYQTPEVMAQQAGAPAAAAAPLLNPCLRCLGTIGAPLAQIAP
jgi:hypothetical protein